MSDAPKVSKEAKEMGEWLSTRIKALHTKCGPELLWSVAEEILEAPTKMAAAGLLACDDEMLNRAVIAQQLVEGITTAIYAVAGEPPEDDDDEEEADQTQVGSAVQVNSPASKDEDF